MNDPIVTLKDGDKVILGIDLWTLVMVYTSNDVMERWNSLKVYLNDEEVIDDRRKEIHPKGTRKGK